MIVDILVEGAADRAVARRLIEGTNHTVGSVFGLRGASYVTEKVRGFNQAMGGREAFLALLDSMELPDLCAGAAVIRLLPHRHKNMLMRLVVREIESWLLADRSGCAKFLGVSIAKIPRDPESLPDPKQSLVNLARQSRSAAVRAALVPEQRSGAIVGPSYEAEIAAFASKEWNAGLAAANAPSLARAMARLSALRPN